MSTTTNSVTDADVNVLKLSNGEEIIAKVTIDSGIAICEQALQIVQMPDGKGQVGMAMMPYMPYTKNFILYATSIVAMGEPIPEFLDSYKRHFSSIVLPPKQSIIAGA